MTLLLIEGFETAQASKLQSKGWQFNASSLVAGRFGGSAAQFGATNNKPFSPSTSLVIGLAWRTSNTTSTSLDILNFSIGASAIVRLVWNSAQRLEVRNNVNTLLATGPSVLLVNTWYFLELKAVIATSGSFEVRLNGVTEIASTAANFGSTPVNAFAWTVPPGNSQYDDIYVLDTTGSAPRNDYLGDIRVVTLFPSADGASSQWTPNSGTAHFSRVNEASGTFPDDDTSYVSDATVGDTDSYVFQDLPAGASAVHAVQVNMYARKDDAASRQIASVVRQAGTTYPGTSVAVPSSYSYLSQIYQQDPTSTDWTVANVNADEFGVRVIA